MNRIYEIRVWKPRDPPPPPPCIGYRTISSTKNSFIFAIFELISNVKVYWSAVNWLLSSNYHSDCSKRPFFKTNSPKRPQTTLFTKIIVRASFLFFRMPYWIFPTGKHAKLIENTKKYSRKGQTGEIRTIFYMDFTLKWPNFSHFYKLQVIAIDFGGFVAKYC